MGDGRLADTFRKTSAKKPSVVAKSGIIDITSVKESVNPICCASPPFGSDRPNPWGNYEFTTLCSVGQAESSLVHK